MAGTTATAACVRLPLLNVSSLVPLMLCRAGCAPLVVWLPAQALVVLGWLPVEMFRFLLKLQEL